MRDIAVAASLAAVAAFTSCSGTSRAQAPSSVPAPTRSPAHTSVRVLTLQEAIAAALANSPRVAEARWESIRASASAEGADAQHWPTVTAGAGYQRWMDAQRLVPIAKPGEAGVFTHDVVSGDLTVHMPLYAGGALDAAVKASRAREQAARHSTERIRQALVFEVTALFYEIVGQRMLLGAFEASRKALAEQRRVLEERIAVDKGAPVDTLRLDVRLAELDQSVTQARNALAIRRRTLAAVIGLDPARVEIDTRAGLVPEPDVPESGTTRVNTRQDLLAAQAEAEARAHEATAARARRWPQVDGVLTYGLRADFDGHLEDVGKAGVFVSVPLFDAGLTSARVREAEARQQLARQRLASLSLEANLGVQSALLDVSSARERLTVSRIAVAQAQQAFDIQREKLAIGRGTTTEVLDAHAALIQSHAAHFGNLTALSIASAKLAYARGEPVR